MQKFAKSEIKIIPSPSQRLLNDSDKMMET